MNSISNRKKISIFLLLLTALFLAGYFFLQYFLNSHILKSSSQSTEYLFIYEEDNIDSVYNKIEKITKKPISNAIKVMAKKNNYAQHIQTGKYSITPKDTPYTLINKLTRGHQTPSKLVFNNIRTKETLAGRLANQLMIDSISVINLFNNELFLDSIGYTPQTIVEIFIPNTYEVYWNISAKDLISRFQKEHKRFWNQERLNKASEAGLSTLEVSILASIVEEETNVPDEKPIVAGLYINRLRRNIPLQADPTVKFALQDFAIKRVLEKDTQIDSPYNTYKNTGLPPGPIRLASQQGLESVLNFASHNYLYMCAKEDFSGRHNFATNLKDHLANSRKYWRELNRRKIYR